MKKSIFLVAMLSFGANLMAQLPVAPVFQKAYDAKTRSVDGSPGKKYWQNTANYNIKIDFNPFTRLVKGDVAVEYINNSPDTLKQLWLKLYPNLYQKGVLRQSKINERDLGDGVQFQSFKIDDVLENANDLKIEGTNMHLDLPAILPGKKVRLNFNYSYVLNKGSHVRTGEIEKRAHFVAYFFPRIAVYDDIDGWNKYPYTGAEEFYNDFCNFNVAITVPKNHMVWATGDLVNAKEVLQPSIYDKLNRAAVQDGVIDVIDSADLASQKITGQSNFNTFKFIAKNVTDFAFATSDHYRWKASSLVVDAATKRRTRVDAVFNPKHKDYFEVIDFARKTVEAMSFKYPKWPFPYAHETIFDGLDQMEYPMMVNDNPLDNREDVITLTDHEIFHTMFPFYMGINETKYGWMDEGWATIGEWLISPIIDPSIVDEYGVKQTAASSGTVNDTPIMTLTPDLKGVGSFTNSYPKPGLGYLFVKDELGEELFTTALHHYITNWNGKHPMPYDFFYSINTASGKNLDWFWKRWFFDGGVTDMAIKKVDKTSSGYKVLIENKGKPLPIYLNVVFSDGSYQSFHRSIGIWEHLADSYDFAIPTDKRIRKIVMGNPHVPDKNPEDNTFSVN